MGLLDRLFGGASAGAGDGELERLLESYLAEPSEVRYGVNPRSLPSGAKLLDLPAERLPELIRVLLRSFLRHIDAAEDNARWYRREKLLSELCRRNLPLSPQDAHEILELHAQLVKAAKWVPLEVVPRAVARAAEAGGWLGEIRGPLERLREAVLSADGAEFFARSRKHAKELEVLIERASGHTLGYRIDDDTWGDKARPALEAMDASLKQPREAVLGYCTTARGSAPSAKWLKAGLELVQALGRDAFLALATELLALLREPGPKKDLPHDRLRRFLLSDANADLLKGIAWLLAHVEEEPAAAALREAAACAFRKIPGHGARSGKLANACLETLKGYPGMLGARHLAVLKASVKLPSQLGAIEKALHECAARLGLPLEEVEELAIPDYGFADGRLAVAFGAAEAQLSLEGSSVALAWRGAGGKPQKSEPASVKREFPEERKALKRLVEDVDKTLAAVRDRLERLPLERREWPLDAWRARFLEHPVVGPMARRLIWRFGERAALWVADRWLDDEGKPVEPAGPVSAWHPVLARADSVQRWRALLSRRGVVQPFKQAHRELYLLTDAERATSVYSNRFAAHVLRQHQFASLCVARGWKYRLQGGFDSHNNPFLLLPKWDLCAEYWVEATGGPEDLTPAGIHLHVVTDQLRFYPLRPGDDPNPWSAPREREPLPLEAVPALVLSEVMRDVDLFVGVASVGADPTWHDGGPDGRYRTYWQSFSFGDLSTSAEARKAIIAELLPSLSIRDRARLDGRFLVVQGTRRTYKIHLGSGNILMEPNDQYLCIVQDRSSRSGDLKLPFEGDSILALVLSKAFLLVQDDRIKDPTIVRQIEQGGITLHRPAAPPG